MLIKTIKEKIYEAMKAKDEVKTSTLKLLLSELINAEIAKNREELTKQEEIKVVKSEAKKRKDAIFIYRKAKALEKAEREEKELEVLKEFLPEEMDDGELKRMVDGVISETGAKTVSEMGKVIGLVMGKAEGKADGKRISEIVREKLDELN